MTKTTTTSSQTTLEFREFGTFQIVKRLLVTGRKAGIAQIDFDISYDDPVQIRLRFFHTFFVVTSVPKY